MCVGGWGGGGDHQYNGTFGTEGLILGWEAVVSSAGTEGIQTGSGDREIKGMLPSSCMSTGNASSQDFDKASASDITALADWA